MIISSFVVLIVALFVLGMAAKYAVEKAIRLAKFFRISEMAAGFIFIAIMTSLPELSVAVSSSTAGQNNLSLGDVLGSNVTNIALILGVCGLIGLRKVAKENSRRMVFLIVLSLLPLVLFIDSELSLSDGIILLFLFFFFIYYVFSQKIKLNEPEEITRIEATQDFLVFVVGIVFVITSAGFAVRAAVEIAQELGIFQSFIGATIMALSTSLPELAVDVTAARKGRGGLVFGDILGSNVTNLTLVLGVNTLLNPFIPNMRMVSSVIAFVLLTAFILIYFLYRHQGLRKNDARIPLALYVVYIAFELGVQLINRP